MVGPFLCVYCTNPPDKDIAELAASISRICLINPFVVAPDGERYRLIAGHRRRGAAAANEQSDPNPQQRGQEPAREGRGELVRPPEQRMSPIRPPS
jgi:hypothetical protein